MPFPLADRVMGEHNAEDQRKPATHKLASELEAKTFSRLHRRKQTKFDFYVPGIFVFFRYSPGRQNQCSKYYLADCRGESPCFLLLVFVSTLPRSAAETSISKTRIVSFCLLKPKGLPPFHGSFLLKQCSHKGSLI